MRALLAVFLLALSGLTTTQITYADGTPQPQKEWTMLVFLNGKNSLDEFGPQNINQMETVGSTDQVNIVVQWASSENGDVRRLYIQKDNDTQNVTSPVVQKLASVDMGDYNSVVDFVKWGVQNYPAKHYFIDMWDHGNGWHKKVGGNGVFQSHDISWDDETGHFITTAQLGQAMTQIAAFIGHKVDLYASDACLMAMAEVAGEMADSVQVFAGSEETEPGPGWPYGDFLAAWAKNPAASAQDVGKMLSSAYTKSYEGGSNGNEEVTFSAMDLGALAQLETAVSNMSQAFTKMSSAEKKKALKAIQSATSFTDPDYVDLADAVNALSNAGISTMSTDLAATMNSAVKALVLESDNTGQYKNAHGISMWFPTDNSTLSDYSAAYKDLQFEAKTKWLEALQALLN